MKFLIICFLIGFLPIMGIYLYKANSTPDTSQEAFRAVNEYRAENGLAALAWSNELEEKAIAHCRYMSETKNFVHSDYDYVENITEGLDPLAGGEEIVEVWIASPLHRGNLLARNISSGAIGVVGIYAAFMAE